MFKRKRILISWSGHALGTTSGNRYFIGIFGYFKDDHGRYRNAKHGQWRKIRPRRIL